MTRIMKLFALATVCTVVGGASAQTDIYYNGPVKQVSPVAAQKILAWHKVGNAYVIDRLGEKVDLSGDFKPASTATAPAYDGLEFDPATIGTSFNPTDNPSYGGNCGIAVGSRFYSGDAIFDGGYTGEINAIPGTAGKLCPRIGYEWYQDTLCTYQNATIVFTSDNFVDGPSALDPNSATNRVDLSPIWLLTYGSILAENLAYIGSLDFGPGTNGWMIPADGRGALTIINCDYDSAGGVAYVGNGQQMRWVIKTGNPTPADYGSCWRDRLLFNGLYDGTWNGGTNEFESRTTTACAGLVKNGRVSGAPCTSICASLTFTPPTVVAPSSFSVGLGQVISGDNASLAADDANALKICKAFVPNVAAPRVRFDADFMSPNLAPSSLQVDLKARMTTGGAFKVRSFLADVSGTDTFVYGVANQVIADTTINLTFATYSSGAVAATNHVDTDIDTIADGTVRARVEIQQTGFSAVAVPCSEFEFLTLTVNP